MAQPFSEVGVRAVVKDFDDYNNKLDSMEKKTSGFGSKLGGALKKGALIGGVALAGLGIAGLKMASDFESSLAEVKTLLPDISETAFGELEKGILQFSKDMGIATSEAIPALYQAISAGIPAENVLEFMTIASKAAIGGVTDLETAVDGITSVVNAYGSEVVDAQKASDIMFTAVKLGKTDFDQLSRSLFQVIPTAASLGISFEEVAAELAVLTAQGVPTSVAATQLRAAFVEASKSTTKLSGAVTELTGKSFADLIKEGKTGAEIFEELRDSMPEQEFKDLFGSVEAMNAVLAITGPNAEKARKAMEETGASAGAVDKAFETISKTVSFKFKKVLNILRIALTQLGLKALPAVSKALGALIKLLDPAVDSLGKFLKGGKDARKAFKALPQPMRAVVQEIGRVTRAGKDLVSFLIAVVTNVEDMGNRFRRLPTDLQPTAATLAWVVAGFKDLGETLLSMVAPVGEIAQLFLELASAVGAEVFQDFVELFSFLLNKVIVPLAEKMADVVGAVGNLGGAFRKNKAAMEIAKNILVPLVEAWLLLLAAKKVVTLTQNIVRAGQAFIRFATLPVRMAQTLTQNVFRTGRAFINIAKLAAFFTQQITQNIKRTGRKLITDFSDKVQSIVQKVTSPTAEAEGKRAGERFGGGFFKSLGKLIVRTLPEFLGGAAVALIVFASSAATIIAGALVAAFAIGFFGAFGVLKLLGESPVIITSFSELGDSYGVAISVGIFQALRTFFTQTLPQFFTEMLPFAAGAFAGLLFAMVRFGIPALAMGLIEMNREIKAFLEGIEDAVDKFMRETLPEAILKGFTFVVTEAVKGWVKVDQAFETAQEEIKQALKTFITSILPGEISAGFPTIRAGFAIGWKAVTDDFPTKILPAAAKFFSETLPSAIVKFFTGMIPDVASAAFNVGKEIIGGLISGIGDIAEQLFKPFEEGFSTVIEKVKGILGIKSPSTVFEEIGKDIVRGLWAGISSLTNWLSRLVKGFAEGIVDAVQEGLGDLWPFSPSEAGIDIGKGLVAGIKKGIGQTLSGLREATVDVRANLLDMTVPQAVVPKRQAEQIRASRIDPFPVGTSAGGGDFNATISVGTEREAAQQLEIMLRRLAFSTGVAGA